MADKALATRGRTLPQHLYGRDHELRQLSERLASRSRHRIVLRGPSGIGKSALLGVLQKRLQAWGGPDACLLQEIESQAHTLNYLLGQLTAQIVEQSLSALPSPRLTAIRQALNERPHEYIWTLVSAAATDVADKLAPNTKRTLESLVDIAGKAAGDSSPTALAERIRRAAQDDILASFLSLLNLLSRESLSGCIMIDRLEAGSEAVQDAVLAIARCLPENWSLLVAVNDEIPEGIQTIYKISPLLSYMGTADFELGPLAVSALELWKNEVSGNPGTIVELHDVIENTGGRPLFLADWVSGLSTEAASRNVVSRLGAYYKQRLSLLSGKGKHLLQLLSLLPSRALLPFSLIRFIVAPQDPFVAYEVVSELEEKHFLKKVAGEGDIYKINHELISKYVARQLPQDTARAAAQELLNALFQSTTRQDQRDSFVEIHLADLAGRDSELLERAIPTAEHLVSTGSYAAAIEIYRKGLRAAENANEQLTAARARLGIATSLLDTGSYHESLEALGQVRVEDQELQARAFLIRGRVLISLNSYNDALTALDQAKARYTALRQASGQIEVEKEVNTILRDLGRHEEAVSQATQLVETAQVERIPPLVQASCYRALARSLALTEEVSSSLKAGSRALDIARAEKSLRAEGNAHLARGEGYRHGRQFPQALEEYQQAANIAEKLANRDSWLWSLLGAADSLLLLDQLDEALARLADLGAVLTGASKRYPLEYLHWRLSVETIRFINGGRSARALRSSATKYARLGIAWPSSYVDQVVVGRMASVPKKM
jgi:tetratricopeptide (TPR) repeat protein